MAQRQDETASVAQLRRLFYPLKTKQVQDDDARAQIPPLLPFTSERQAEQWADADIEVQLLLAQIVRQTILPWYGRITSDRDFIVEIVDAIRSALRIAFCASTVPVDTTGTCSALSRLLVEEVPVLLITHYQEFRRASDIHPSVARSKGTLTAAQIYLASNPHPALTLSQDGRLKVSEAYLDLLCRNLLHTLLPEEHYRSQSESGILCDIIKGSFVSQLRLRGHGAWVFVRVLAHLVDDAPQTSTLSSPLSTSQAKSQRQFLHAGSIVTSLLYGLHTLASLLMPLVVRAYIDLFTPNADLRRTGEPASRGTKLRRRKIPSDSSAMRRSNSNLKHNNDDGNKSETSGTISILPGILFVAEALELPKRALGSFVVWLCQLSVLWNLDESIARQLQTRLDALLTPEKVTKMIRSAREALVESQNGPSPTQAIEPTLTEQCREYDDLLRSIVQRISGERISFFATRNAFATSPILKLIAAARPLVAQIMLGMSEDAQEQVIRRALDPFLSPPVSIAKTVDTEQEVRVVNEKDRERPSSLTEIADTRLLLCLFERALVMLNPSVAASTTTLIC